MKGYQFSVTEQIDLRQIGNKRQFPATGSASNEFIKSSAYDDRIGI
jgi:hypothetical protein